MSISKISSAVDRWSGSGFGARGREGLPWPARVECAQECLVSMLSGFPPSRLLMFCLSGSSSMRWNALVGLSHTGHGHLSGACTSRGSTKATTSKLGIGLTQVPRKHMIVNSMLLQWVRWVWGAFSRSWIVQGGPWSLSKIDVGNCSQPMIGNTIFCLNAWWQSISLQKMLDSAEPVFASSSPCQQDVIPWISYKTWKADVCVPLLLCVSMQLFTMVLNTFWSTIYKERGPAKGAK